MTSWYNSTGAENDIVVSTRIRLARNLSDIPFPNRMTEAERDELKNRVKSAIYESNTPFAKNLKYIDMANVPENEIGAMVERHIISPEFATSRKSRAIILSQDESISIMIGEEDHIRIQVTLAGLELERAYDIAERLDLLLYEKLNFAFDRKLGFLTECPTNLGTGLRASVMLHLPVTEANSEIALLSETVGKIGFTIRGMYGEGSKSGAQLYQISNQITLGISEKNALDNLKTITTQLVAKERNARAKLDTLKMEDISYRALGILQNCRILSSKEMATLISRIKLAQSMGILNIKVDPMVLLIDGKPHMLMKRHGEISPEERDIYRAADIREALS